MKKPGSRGAQGGEEMKGCIPIPFVALHINLLHKVFSIRNLSYSWNLKLSYLKIYFFCENSFKLNDASNNIFRTLIHDLWP